LNAHNSFTKFYAKMRAVPMMKVSRGWRLISRLTGDPTDSHDWLNRISRLTIFPTDTYAKRDAFESGVNDGYDSMKSIVHGVRFTSTVFTPSGICHWGSSGY